MPAAIIVLAGGCDRGTIESKPSSVFRAVAPAACVLAALARFDADAPSTSDAAVDSSSVRRVIIVAASPSTRDKRQGRLFTLSLIGSESNIFQSAVLLKLAGVMQ
jgi:hypothetical protein